MKSYGSSAIRLEATAIRLEASTTSSEKLLVTGKTGRKVKSGCNKKLLGAPGLTTRSEELLAACSRA